jgi:clan AA aspartic protease
VITGSVNSLREALVRLAILGPHGQKLEVEAIVDTGYNGALTLPAAMVAALRLPFRSRGRAVLGDGSTTFINSYVARVVWGQETRRLVIDASESEPLLGTALLDGHELTIQMIEAGEVAIRELLHA